MGRWDTEKEKENAELREFLRLEMAIIICACFLRVVSCTSVLLTYRRTEAVSTQLAGAADDL